MTIAYIITKGEIGGAQTWTRDQVHLFSKTDSQIIITNQPGWLSNECSSVASSFFFSNIETFSLFTFFSIVRLIISKSVDTIVASSANAGVYARLCKIICPRVRIVYVSHGWSCIYNGGKYAPLFMMIERVLSYLTDVVLCVSEQDKYNAVEILKIPKRKVICIRNRVFSSFKKDSDIIGRPLKVLFVGRLDRPKRPDLLIEALAGDSRFTLDIVGDGPLRNGLSSASNVHYHGSVSSFDKFYQYDVFALISDSEGLPMAALEAASTGLPLLLSNVGGCPELIGKNGILVNNDVESIRYALDIIEHNYYEFKECARLKSSDFDLSKSYQEYYRVYFSV
ncbi:glycosyltransferase [Vibrio vulnificus]|uniref:glycosyltransferase n=1 Tax=Vibrio vulnificus TaxID=672 RepID=UPI004058307C|nr:glycosyltransferase family 4 protein [Vibrio vulnificus]